MLREVAKRYLPDVLSQRSKRPFPVDAPKRFRIAPEFFEKSFIPELFGLSSRETQYLTNNVGHTLLLKLLQLDVWAHVSLNNLPKQPILSKFQSM